MTTCTRLGLRNDDVSVTSFKMPFSREDTHLIKLLSQEKQYSSRYFLKGFPNRHCVFAVTAAFEAFV